jgi:hypothetical protein
MSDREFLLVDPATLHLPGGRRDGVDPMIAEETRAELLAALAELGRAQPNWRLGQAISNLAMAAGHLDAGAVWDLEDGEALAAARRLLESRSNTPVTTG